MKFIASVLLIHFVYPLNTINYRLFSKCISIFEQFHAIEKEISSFKKGNKIPIDADFRASALLKMLDLEKGLLEKIALASVGHAAKKKETYLDVWNILLYTVVESAFCFFSLTVVIFRKINDGNLKVLCN